jgi:hypothetical protein
MAQATWARSAAGPGVTGWAVVRREALLVALAFLTPACAASSPRAAAPATTTSTSTSTTTTSAVSAATNDPVLLAAGDIASCSSPGDAATAAVLRAQPVDAPIAALGDLAYEAGSVADFRNCFDPTWGPFKARIHPALGNHEYGTKGAAGYFGEFAGSNVGTPGQGWYSWDVGAWHLVALNSNCDTVGCGPDSPQVRWLRADLAAHPAMCTVAYWHHPRWSSGLHGDQAQVDGLWKAVAAGGVDLVLSGHDHDYERFAPIDGVREFVVGTGGASHYPRATHPATSEVWDGSSFGVLRLTLHPTSYEWRFLPAAGSTFTDSGSAACRR